MHEACAFINYTECFTYLHTHTPQDVQSAILKKSIRANAQLAKRGKNIDATLICFLVYVYLKKVLRVSGVA